MSITVTVKGGDKCELSEKFAACAFEESPKVSTITQYLQRLAQHKNLGQRGLGPNFILKSFEFSVFKIKHGNVNNWFGYK